MQELGHIVAIQTGCHDISSFLLSVLKHGRWETKIGGGSRDVVSLVPEICMIMSLPVQ